MAKQDTARTTFVMDDGINYYIWMPFGLKNIGADFQKGMNKAFEVRIGKIVVVYLYDIIVKSEDLGQVIYISSFFQNSR